MFASPRLRRASHLRSLTFTVLAGVLLSAVATLLLFTASAHAVVTPVEVKAGETTTFGLQPANMANVQEGNGREILETGLEQASPAEPQNFANPIGHAVLHGSQVFFVYWDPAGNLYHGDWREVIGAFAQSLAGASGAGGKTPSLASVFAVDSQYTDSTNKPAVFNTSYRGSLSDTHPYPAHGCNDPQPENEGGGFTCLTDAQLRAQLGEYITVHKLPTGMSTVYYLLTPPGVTVCLDGGAERCSDFTHSKEEGEKLSFKTPSYKNSFCSYHAAINPGGLATGDGNTVLYAAVPWTAGGIGDNHLVPAARLEAPYCQDGGFDPSSKKPVEKREKVEPRNAAEEEEFKKKSPLEQEELENEKNLQAPHDQQPNQMPCPTKDGGCDTGLADLIVNQIAVEQQNIVTDPLLNAWKDPAGNESSDECRNWFADSKLNGGVIAGPETGAGTLSNQIYGLHNYYVNDAFNLAALLLPYPGIPCLVGAALEPHFTAANPVNAGELVGFDGNESNIALESRFGYQGGFVTKEYAKFVWNFGDGTSPVEGYAPGAPPCESPSPFPTTCAASLLHSYQYGGTYDVSLTATDVGGNTATFHEAITVNGPPRPASPETSSSGSSGASSSSSASTGAASSGASSTAAGTSGGSAPHVTLSPPLAATALVSHSLRRALRNGLSVRYSVNQQVAGRFEVLLSRTLAKRLGILGTRALGLPAGMPAQLVIAKAVLITTKPGRNAVTIQFSKRTAQRLAKLKKVTLLLRLIVHNAASASPGTTTVLSSYTLSG